MRTLVDRRCYHDYQVLWAHLVSKQSLHLSTYSLLHALLLLSSTVSVSRAPEVSSPPPPRFSLLPAAALSETELNMWTVWGAPYLALLYLPIQLLPGSILRTNTNTRTKIQHKSLDSIFRRPPNPTIPPISGTLTTSWLLRHKQRGNRRSEGYKVRYSLYSYSESVKYSVILVWIKNKFFVCLFKQEDSYY